jgi:hypothetical protein
VWFPRKVCYSVDIERWQGETAINIPIALGNINVDSLYHYSIRLWRLRRGRGVGVTVNS